LPCVFEPERRSLGRRLLAARPVAWLGLVSYGSFLYHRPIVTWLWQHGAGSSGHAWLGYATLVAASFAVTSVPAAGSDYLVEPQFLRLKASAKDEKPRPRPAPATPGRPAYPRAVGASR